MRLLFLLALVIAPSVSLAQDAQTTEKLQQIAQRFDQNRESFTHGRYRFEYIRGKSNWKTASKGDAPENESVGNGLYIFDGNQWRLELLYEPDALLAHGESVGDNTRRSDIQAFRALTDGRKTFYHQISPAWRPDIVTDTAQIGAGSERFYAQFPIPLEIGRPLPTSRSFSVFLKRALEGEFRIESVDWNSTLDSTPVVEVTFASEKGSRTYWIDPERGAVPLLVEDRIEKSGSIVRQLHDDLRFFPEAGWLPFRTTRHESTSGVVEHTRLLECELTRVPSRADFQLVFEQPISVINAADALKYPPSATWSLIDLPTTPGAKAQPIQILGPITMEDQMPGERPAGWPWWVPTLIGLGVVLLLLFLTQKFWRRGYAA